jgi:hypothetical protein
VYRALCDPTVVVVVVLFSHCRRLVVRLSIDALFSQRAMGDGGDKGMVVVFSDIRVDNAIAMTRLESVLRSFAEVVEVHRHGFVV